MGFDCIRRHDYGDRLLLCWLCPKGSYGVGDYRHPGCRFCPAGMKITLLAFLIVSKQTHLFWWVRVFRFERNYNNILNSGKLQLLPDAKLVKTL